MVDLGIAGLSYAQASLPVVEVVVTVAACWTFMLSIALVAALSGRRWLNNHRR